MFLVELFIYSIKNIYTSQISYQHVLTIVFYISILIDPKASSYLKTSYVSF